MTTDETTIQVDATEIKKRKADNRGRVRLGPEYADLRVKVAVLGVQAEDPERYTCEECGEEHPLSRVLVLGASTDADEPPSEGGADRIVCGDCAVPEDRVV